MDNLNLIAFKASSVGVFKSIARSVISSAYLQEETCSKMKMTRHLGSAGAQWQRIFSRQAFEGFEGFYVSKTQ